MDNTTFVLLAAEKKKNLATAAFEMPAECKYYFVKYTTKIDRMHFYEAKNKALLKVASCSVLLFALKNVSKHHCSYFVQLMAAKNAGENDLHLWLITAAFEALGLPMFAD